MHSSRFRIASLVLLLGSGLGTALLLPGEPTRLVEPSFTDITRESGLAAIVADKYTASPKWWLSGLHLVDLDGDGHLDLFLSAHGGGGAVAALGDGKGRFTLAPGSYPTTEI